MRFSDAGVRQFKTKAVYPNHRLPPWLTQAAVTGDRSNLWLGSLANMSVLTYTTSRESKRQAARLASRRDQNSTDVAGSETRSGVTAARRKPGDASVQADAKYWAPLP
jgi:hypothetical protein